MKLPSSILSIKSLILLGAFFLINIHSSAQIRHGLHVMAGISKIQTTSNLILSTPTEIEVLDNFDFSWTLGYTASNSFGNDLILQFGADALLLNAKRMESQYRSEDNFSNFDYEMSAIYIGIPVLIGIKKQNISILTGVRASIFLAGSIDIYSMGEDYGDPFTSMHSDDMNLDRFDAGHHTELKYGLGENLEVILSYYYGVNALFKTSQSPDYYQQVSVGVGYLFS